MSENEYVLVIHGTWNPPTQPPAKPAWHQLDEDEGNFCKRLNDELEALGQGRPVWHSVNGNVIDFGWSGDNQHEDRVEAGKRLALILQDMIDIDPDARIHIVAHSHGANVVLTALQEYMEQLGETAAAQYRDFIDACVESKDTTTKIPGLTHFAGEAALREELSKAIDQPDHSETNPNQKRKPWLSQVWKRARNRTSAIDLKHDDQEFVDAWLRSQETNRIGHLVFMGAPFFTKRWHRTLKWAPTTLIGKLIDLVFAALFGIALTYFVIQFFWTVYVWGGGTLLDTIFSFNASPATSMKPELNPVLWPRWLQIASGFFVLIYAAVGLNEFQGSNDDVNLYFDDQNIKTNKKTAAQSTDAFPFNTLTVHAGLLDEVFLGFSAEPLVYGALVPRIKSLFDKPFRLSGRSRPLGKKPGPHNHLFRAIGMIGYLLLAGLAWVINLLAPLWQRFLTRQILKVVSSPAFGLDSKEFSNAQIRVDSTINMPECFNEHARDVSSQLTQAPAKRSAAQQQIQRYAFLKDLAQRKKRQSESKLWKEIDKSLEDIEKRYRRVPDTDIDQAKDRLLNATLMLEERAREVAGTVEMVHSAYYTNDDVIQKVADFIATGRP